MKTHRFSFHKGTLIQIEYNQLLRDLVCEGFIRELLSVVAIVNQLDDSCDIEVCPC